MAKLARDYHNDLQSDGLTLPTNSPEHAQKLKRALEEIPATQKLQDPEESWGLPGEQVKKVILFAKNGSATGVDGCPYELWKKLSSLFKKAEEEGKEGFDIKETLIMVFRDIQEHGVDRRMGFAE